MSGSNLEDPGSATSATSTALQINHVSRPEGAAAGTGDGSRWFAGDQGAEALGLRGRSLCEGGCQGPPTGSYRAAVLLFRDGAGVVGFEFLLLRALEPDAGGASPCPRPRPVVLCRIYSILLHDKTHSCLSADPSGVLCRSCPKRGLLPDTLCAHAVPRSSKLCNSPAKPSLAQPNPPPLPTATLDRQDSANFALPSPHIPSHHASTTAGSPV